MKKILGLWLLSVAACGGGSSVASCDQQGTGDNNYCQEYQATAELLAPYKAACTKGTYADAPCSRPNAVGGCRTTTMGITVTNWFYFGTKAQLMSACASSSSTFVEQ